MWTIVHRDFHLHLLKHSEHTILCADSADRSFPLARIRQLCLEGVACEPGKNQMRTWNLL